MNLEQQLYIDLFEQIKTGTEGTEHTEGNKVSRLRENSTLHCNSIGFSDQ